MAGGGNTVDEFRHNAARLVVERLPGRVMVLRFSGPITVPTMKALGMMASLATSGATGLLFRLDTATLLIDDLELLHKPTNEHQRISGAMVVSPDQLPMFDAYSHASAKRGINRAVFLPNELPQARRWLEAESRASHGLLQPSQPETQSP